ncbi:DNA primase [Paludifilum halophilum]|uniref:DNA primase n=1 Tax=Paludifilum halophilum TaxID=1642702 RepID=A0A235B5V5_9BACL|nr:DNA primase [Paludifilum halophilum]OYD07686.1 DNA primase [Paludifilum halophilum]
MGRIPDEVIDRVREHHDIVDVVGRTVQLKKSGRNYFGLCPFHSEKNPSFSVSPDKQIYYCFGCGAGGNVFKFLMEAEQLSFVEAVTQLAEQAGIEIPQTGGAEGSEEEDRRQRLRQVLDLAARLYHHLLTRTEYGKAARDYLQKRGIEHRTIEEFQLGYAPDSYHFLLRFMKRRGYDERLLMEAGLVAEREHSTGRPSYFDRFRRRVMFPIHDSQGRVIGFGGRMLGEGHPKYLNSPETDLFHKGKFLFNLHRARKVIRRENQAVLFEGYMDVISAWQAGICGGVASLGTSLTDSQARVIRRNAETAVICYDSDTAGNAAAERGLDVLKKRDCIVKVARMPDGMDPDDYIRERGSDSFRSDVIAQALPFAAFKLESLKKEFDLKDEEQRMRYLTRAVEVIADLPLAIERDHYLRRLAEEFHISLDALKQEHRGIASKKKREAKRDKGRGKWNNGYHEGKHMVGDGRRPLAHEEAERRLLTVMMNDRQVADRVQDTVGADFNVEIYAAIAAYLYAYYAEGHEPDPGRLIHYVKDDRLVREISALMMTDHPEQVLEEEVTDYIRLIRNYPLHMETENVQKRAKQAELSGDALKAAQMGLEYIERLRAKKSK